MLLFVCIICTIAAALFAHLLRDASVSNGRRVAGPPPGVREEYRLARASKQARQSKAADRDKAVSA